MVPHWKTDQSFSSNVCHQIPVWLQYHVPSAQQSYTISIVSPKDLLYSKAHNENCATLPSLNDICHTMYYKSDRFQQEGNFALPANGANIETAQPDAPKAKHGDPYRKKNQ